MNRMGYCLEHEKYKELLIYSKKDFKIIKRQIELIGNEYIGHLKEISDKMKELEHEIKHKNNEIKQKDLEKDNALLRKENEILVLQNENKLLIKDLQRAKTRKHNHGKI
jgi:uncharacterized membrane protein YgaE (UPF0421/DUF939 family)